jgi:hypothetical protein
MHDQNNKYDYESNKIDFIKRAFFQKKNRLPTTQEISYFLPHIKSYRDAKNFFSLIKDYKNLENESTLEHPKQIENEHGNSGLDIDAGLKDKKDHFYDGCIKYDQTKFSTRASSSYKLKISVENKSQFKWSSQDDIFLCFRWYDRNKKYISEGVRTTLDNDLPSMQLNLYNIQIVTPKDPELYFLELTLVHENQCWFEQRGFKSYFIEVDVQFCASISTEKIINKISKLRKLKT